MNGGQDAATQQSNRGSRFLAPLIRIGLFVVIGYLVLLIMIGLLQRYLIYHPLRASAIDPMAAGLPEGRVHPIHVRAKDGLVLHGWHALADGQTASSPEECNRELACGRPLILYFPGNAANRSYRGAELKVFGNLGADVFIVDYRGYGENAGSPTETHLAADARALWDYAVHERRVAPERIVLHGESLGGGVAVRLAAALSEEGTPPGGLVLRATFASLSETGAHHFPLLPVRWLLTDRFSSIENIPKVTCPILQYHGTRDQVVPFEHGRRLFDAAPATSADGVPKRFLEIPDADHNDVLMLGHPEIAQATREFLEMVRQRASASARARKSDERMDNR